MRRSDLVISGDYPILNAIGSVGDRLLHEVAEAKARLELAMGELQREMGDARATKLQAQLILQHNNLLGIYQLVQGDPGIVLDKVHQLPVHCQIFLAENPAYILVLLDNAIVSVSSHQNAAYPTALLNPKYRAAVAEKLKLPLKHFESVFATINTLFANIAATLAQSKYKRDSGYDFLFALSEHVKNHFLNDGIKNRVIRNLLLTHTQPEIDVVNLIRQFNLPREPQVAAKKSKAAAKKRLNIPMEILIRLAVESGFAIDKATFQDFYRNNMYAGVLDDVITAYAKIDESKKPPVSDQTPDAMRHEHLDADQYMFNPLDVELNAFTAKFMDTFHLRAAAYNEDPANARNKFQVRSDANISFFRFSVNDAAHDIICISLSKNGTKENVVKFTREFIESYLRPDGAELVFIDPDHHAVKSAIPFLYRIAVMSDKEVAFRYEARKNNRNQAGDEPFTDFFKECSELYGAGFLSQVLRKYPHLTFKSASNHFFRNVEADLKAKYLHKPMCPNCCLKKQDYMRELAIANLVGIYAGDMEQESHSEVYDVKRVAAVVAAESFYDDSSPQKGGGAMKRSRNFGMFPEIAVNSPPRAMDQSPLKKSREADEVDEASSTDDDGHVKNMRIDAVPDTFKPGMGH